MIIFLENLSSNAGYVNAGSDEGKARTTPHAFSHFTFVKSNYKHIVVDIQGVQVIIIVIIAQLA